MATPVITQKAAEDLQLGKNGSYSNSGNVLDHFLYDNMDFQNTTFRNETTFFSIPFGGVYMTANKTLTETNLREVGKLPNGQTFLIKAISFAYIPSQVSTSTDLNANLADYITIMQNTTFEIKIAGREFDFQAPGSTFLSPITLAGQSIVVDATTRTGTTGDYISSGWIKLAATPIPIGQLVSFNVIMKTGAADPAIGLRLDTASDQLESQRAQIQCRLKGILTRAI